MSEEGEDHYILDFCGGVMGGGGADGFGGQTIKTSLGMR